MPLLKLADGTLHYELTGQGPPVLWIQGTGVCGSAWEPQFKELSRDFQCLGFDNRGIGRSVGNAPALSIEQMARDAIALMDEVGWEAAHVVGHSMGGLIAQQVALEAPSRVRSLGLLCTFAKGAEAARLTGKVLWMGLRTRIGTRAMRRQAFLEMLFPAEYLQSQNRVELAARVGPMVGRDLADSPSIMMRQLSAMRKYDAAGKLGHLASIPTLVASAQSDPIALTSYGEGLAARIQGSRYLVIPNSSHGVTIQLPEVINELLRTHFVQADSDSRSRG